MHQSDDIRHLINGLRVGHHRKPCPICGPGRKPIHQRETTLSLEIRSDKALYRCHHCGINGSINPKEEKPMQVVVSTSDKYLQYLKSRGISKSTADLYGCSGALAYTSSTGHNSECVAFPYYSIEGDLEATKYRAIDGKGFSCNGSPKDLWRIDLAKEGDIWITEGEIDAMSLVEIGLQAFSVPNGAQSAAGESGNGSLWRARSILDKASRIVVALDNDEPGQKAAEELARRLGRHRCWRPVWPQGIKDANEALVKLGVGSFKAITSRIEPWPVSGLYSARHFYDEVADIHLNGLTRGSSTGFYELDNLYTINPGELSIVTGVPSAGKSEFVDQLMINLAERDRWKFSICSFENVPKVHIAKLISKRLKKNFWGKVINDKEFDEAFNWVTEHFSFLYHSSGELSSLDSILERLRAAVMRYGIKGAVIDPYNYISRPKDGSETDWISEMLTKVAAFCKAHSVHVWFVAHPTKLPRQADGSLPVPGGYEISGSAAWFSKADCGLTVHRSDDQPNAAMIKIWKIRFAWIGKQGKLWLSYDPATTCYAEGYIERDPLAITGTEWEYKKELGNG